MKCGVDFWDQGARKYPWRSYCSCDASGAFKTWALRSSEQLLPNFGIELKGKFDPVNEVLFVIIFINRFIMNVTAIGRILVSTVGNEQE